MKGWFDFWLFMTVFVVCETYLYSHGHDTIIWKHKTPAELDIQAKHKDAQQ